MARKLVSITYLAVIAGIEFPFKTQEQAEEFAERVRKGTTSAFKKASNVPKDGTLEPFDSLTVDIIGSMPATVEGAEPVEFAVKTLSGPVRTRGTSSTPGTDGNSGDNDDDNDSDDDNDGDNSENKGSETPPVQEPAPEADPAEPTTTAPETPAEPTGDTPAAPVAPFRKKKDTKNNQ